MNKLTKTLLIVTGALVVVVLAFLAYTKFFEFKSFQYSTTKGQRYELKYFKDGEVVDSGELAQKFDSSEIKAGKSMLVSYPEDDLGIAISITDTLDKPLTKSCTGTDRLAFTVGDYEVCKFTNEPNQRVLLAKVGNDNKYFVVTIATIADGKRVSVSKDLAYGRKVIDFNLMDYQRQLKTILKSIHPVN